MQYPATWTPAPTPTNTPPGSTATLVIQRMPEPATTRDPNATRDAQLLRLPLVPRGEIGVWLDTTTLSADTVTLLAPRARVFASTNPDTLPRTSSRFVLLAVDSASAYPASIPPGLDGVLVERASAASAEDLTALRQTIAPRILIAGLGPGEETPEAGPPEADGLCTCSFLRPADAPPARFPDEIEWKRDVDQLASLSSDPGLVVLTATRFAPGVPTNPDLMQKWLDYGLGSFLLGVRNNRSFFGFQGPGAQELLTTPSLVAPLGTPAGAFFRANGVYQRRFTGGLVLVNPAAESRTLLLSRSYLTVTGSGLDRVRLDPHSSIIVLEKR